MVRTFGTPILLYDLFLYKNNLSAGSFESFSSADSVQYLTACATTQKSLRLLTSL